MRLLSMDAKERSHDEGDTRTTRGRRQDDTRTTGSSSACC